MIFFKLISEEEKIISKSSYSGLLLIWLSSDADTFSSAVSVFNNPVNEVIVSGILVSVTKPKEEIESSSNAILRSFEPMPFLIFTK